MVLATVQIRVWLLRIGARTGNLEPRNFHFNSNLLQDSQFSFPLVFSHQSNGTYVIVITEQLSLCLVNARLLFRISKIKDNRVTWFSIFCQIDQMWAGCKYSGFLDRFSLFIPFCLDYIKCKFSSFLFFLFCWLFFTLLLIFPFIHTGLIPWYVAGDVIYNAQCPLAAPDIIFGPEDENFHPFSVIGDEGDLKLPKNSLSDWNSKDPSRLLTLIHELRLGVSLSILSWWSFG